MSETAIEVIDLREEGVRAIGRAASFEIADDLDNCCAGEVLRQIKTVLKEVDERFDKPIKDAHATHKSILALKKDITTPLIQSEAIYKRKMGDYRMEQEHKAREEADRLRKIEQEKAEAAKIEQAAKLESEGHNEEAQRVIESPVIVQAPIVRVPPKVEGVSTRKVWKYRIVDEIMIPRQFMEPDLKAIGSFARSMGAKAKIEGVEFYEDTSVAVRA